MSRSTVPNVSSEDIEIIHKILLSGQPVFAGDVSAPARIHLSVENDEPDFETVYTRKFYYINNPTGQIRWFFPADSAQPAYLSLYNSASLKAWAYKFATEIAFSSGTQKRLTSGSFEVWSDQGIPLVDLLRRIPHDNFGVFTGTFGENRKSIIALNQGKKTTHFVKVAHSNTAEKLLQNEMKMLNLMGEGMFSATEVPVVYPDSTAQNLILSNVRPDKYRDSSRMEVLHVKALEEWYSQFTSGAVLEEADFYHQITANLAQIMEMDIADPQINKETIRSLVRGIKQLYHEVDEGTFVPLSIAHGDFTPWNMYLSKDKVHVYDWELAKEQMPLLFDFFHYVYQSGILLIRQSPRRIQTEIRRSFLLPGMYDLVKKYRLDINLCHKLYFLYITTYYLKIYLSEPHVHTQVHWLLNTWNHAVQELNKAK